MLPGRARYGRTTSPAALATAAVSMPRSRFALSATRVSSQTRCPVKKPSQRALPPPREGQTDAATGESTVFPFGEVVSGLPAYRLPGCPASDLPAFRLPVLRLSGAVRQVRTVVNTTVT